MGRPSTFTPEIAAKICEELAAGLSLRAICRKDGMPPESTVRQWEIDNVEGFAAQSARARETGCHSMADECLEIADDGSNDWMKSNKPDDNGYVLNGEHVQRAKLRIDTRMRLLGKWLPKVYGDKQQIEHSGQIDVAQAILAARKRGG